MHLYTEGLTVIRQRQMRQRLQDLDATLPPLDPPNSTNWLKIILVALVVALAAFGVWRYLTKEDEPIISGPIAAVFEPYPALGITMGEDDKTIRLEALKMYAKKDYKNAIPLLEKAFTVEKDSLLLFYKGISYIGNGESLKAIPVFESLQTSTTLPIDTVEWFLALAYFETNQKEKAVILLKNVANTEGGKYQAKAAELILKMKLK
jgi:tetratricopeptide (TPR) repeat protein